MRMLKLKVIVITAAVLLPGLAVAQAQTKAKPQANKNLTKLMIQSYDLLEAGKLDAAEKIYQQVLQKDPGNPLALNNLGAIMVKKGKYRAALVYLQQARVRAKDYKVKVNRLCSIAGICLAFRPLEEVYGNQDLEPLITLNLRMLKAKMSMPAPGND